ncbi:hypothetical protein [Psychrobacillus lasiicapitis]|uniref:Uncharacterized protein n=1 Tax=Psychrobacillus lasiicapitis TaxID=1636719 RepID=A0A544T386_9BACI|nr:hypothetical protein [Psychrobacillus lasiicapitis]TQR11917.1 hypothetical protein FG382_14995 [Psychrobacillus lasiicapitis]GGA20417.1 hypothetical protein GCM10011384_07310 [Psychrobacillus lasiicapitis]
MKIKLDAQLHVARNGILDLSKIKPVQNQEYMAKPKYGFWTTTYINKKVGSYFSKDFTMDDGEWYKLEPEEAEIFVVETGKDIDTLLSNYSRSNFLEDNTFIDFEKLTEDFDTLHLLKSCFDKGSPVKELLLYDQTLNIHNSDFHPFHQWWTESTLWFKPRFNSCEKINK